MRWAVMVLGIALFLACGSGDSGPNKITIYNACADEIRDGLRAPSTAAFAATREKDAAVTELGSSQYRVNSYVDAQNGFGAKIRSRWECEIELLDDERYRVLSAQVLE